MKKQTRIRIGRSAKAPAKTNKRQFRAAPIVVPRDTDEETIEWMTRPYPDELDGRATNRRYRWATSEQPRKGHAVRYTDPEFASHTKKPGPVRRVVSRVKRIRNYAAYVASVVSLHQAVEPPQPWTNATE